MFRRAVQVVVILLVVWGVAFTTNRTTLDPVSFSVELLTPPARALQGEWVRAQAWWAGTTPEEAVRSASAQVNNVKCVRELLPPDGERAVEAAERTAARAGGQLLKETTGRDLGFTDECLLRR